MFSCRYLRKTLILILTWTVVLGLGETASAVSTISGADISGKTYTMSDVDRSQAALIENTKYYTIGDQSYRGTSMQGMNVGTSYIYAVKTESTTGVNGNEAMTCMWRVKLSNGSKVQCVFKNEGSAVYSEYSTDLKHANDILVRKYTVGSDSSETNNIFACTLNVNLGVVRLKAAGSDSSGRPQFDFGGYYKMVTSDGMPFAPAAMRYLMEYTDPDIGETSSYFLCKNGMDFCVCRIPYTDLGGSHASPSVIPCYKLFTIDTHNAYFADRDGKGTPGTIPQLQGWTNQGFYYNSTENAIYVPLYNRETTKQSVILVYDTTDLLIKGNLTAQLSRQTDTEKWVFPSALTFNVINVDKWEIESVGFPTGAQSVYPLYFNTNSTAAKEGIWKFNYTRGSEDSCIRRSILDNDDGSQKIYYIVHYEANGGTQDRTVPWRQYMMDTAYVRGITTQLCKNTFVKTGYTFAGWHLTRASDGKTLYTVTQQNSDGTTSSSVHWYAAGQQPSGAEMALYKDCRNVSKLSTVNGDVVTCTAQWDAV